MAPGTCRSQSVPTPTPDDVDLQEPHTTQESSAERERERERERIMGASLSSDEDEDHEPLMDDFSKRLDGKMYSGPGADEKLVESMAKQVLECLKDVNKSRVFVGGWSGIGRRRVMDHVVAALPTSVRRSKDGDFSGCVRVTVRSDVSPGFQIRRMIEQLLQMRLLGSKEDMHYWRKIAKDLEWKPLVAIVENLQNPIEEKSLGIPSFVKDSEEDSHPFMKMAYTTLNQSFLFDRTTLTRVRNKFDGLTDEVALQMVVYEANQVTMTMGREWRTIVEEMFFSIKEESFDSRIKDNAFQYMMQESVAPSTVLLQNNAPNNLQGDHVIQILFYCTLFPRLQVITFLDSLRSENLLFNFPNSSDENSWSGFLIFLAILYDLRDRSFLDLEDDFRIKIREPLKKKFASLASSSSLTSSSLTNIRQFQGHLVKHSKLLRKVDTLEWPWPEDDSCNHIQKILLPPSSVSSFPKLSTLILQDNPTLENIRDDVFQFMPNLRILNLDGSRIETLPSSLSCLQNLRMLSLEGCGRLQTIEMTGLDNLEVLNLNHCPLSALKQASWCHMQSLKHFSLLNGLQSLQELQLSLKSVKVFDQFPTGGPLSLMKASQLQKFSIVVLYPEEEDEMQRRRTQNARFETSQFCYKHIHAQVNRLAYVVDPTAAGVAADKCLKIHGGEGLWSLYTLTGIFRPHFLSLHNYVNVKEGIWPIPELKTCYIKCCNDMEYAFNYPDLSLTEERSLESLETLGISSLAKLQSIWNHSHGYVTNPHPSSFQLLKSINLEYCPNLLVLFQVTVDLPKLEVMEIRFCSRLEKLFTWHTTGEIVLPRLKRLHLCGLPKLTSICDQGSLPSIQKLEISGCWNLKKVPLPSSLSDSDRVAAKVVVQAEEKWWMNVQGLNKDRIDFKVGFTSAAPKHIPAAWKRGGRRQRVTRGGKSRCF